MKKILLLSLFLSSTALQAAHHGTHDMADMDSMGDMHSHEGHIHEQMVDGKELAVDPQRFDQFMIGIESNAVAVVSVQGMVCDFCARGIEKTAQLCARSFFACRGRHHHGQAWIFKFDRAGTFRHRHIGGATDDRMGMNMGGMYAAIGHNIDPKAVECDGFVAQIKVEIFRKLRDMQVQRGHYIFEDWKTPIQIGEGGIACVTGKIILVTPVLTGLIIFRDSQAGGSQLIGVNSGAVLRERSVIQAGCEKRFDIGHRVL